MLPPLPFQFFIDSTSLRPSIFPDSCFLAHPSPCRLRLFRCHDLWCPFSPVMFLPFYPSCWFLIHPPSFQLFTFTLACLSFPPTFIHSLCRSLRLFSENRNIFFFKKFQCHYSSPSFPLFHTESAHFKSKFRAETYKRGESGRLVCEAFGERPIKIDWIKDGQVILVDPERRYVEKKFQPLRHPYRGVACLDFWGREKEAVDKKTKAYKYKFSRQTDIDTLSPSHECETHAD